MAGLVSGIRVFTSLEEALALGYEVYDKTANGYLVRILLGERWALALVDLRRNRPQA